MKTWSFNCLVKDMPVQVRYIWQVDLKVWVHVNMWNPVSLKWYSYRSESVGFAMSEEAAFKLIEADKTAIGLVEADSTRWRPLGTSSE